MVMTKQEHKNWVDFVKSRNGCNVFGYNVSKDLQKLEVVLKSIARRGNKYFKATHLVDDSHCYNVFSLRMVFPYLQKLGLISFYSKTRRGCIYVRCFNPVDLPVIIDELKGG